MNSHRAGSDSEFQKITSFQGESPSSRDLFPSQLEANVDLDLLEYGSNLIYFVLGSDTFAAQQMSIVKKFLSISPKFIRCANLGGTESNASSSQIKNIATGLMENAQGKRSLLIVHGVESVPDNQLSRLNFIYRLTDSHSADKFSNLLVGIIWNNDTLPLNSKSGVFPQASNSSDDDNKEEEFDIELEWQNMLKDRWSRGGPHVNGEALVGRISRTAFGDKGVNRNMEGVVTLSQFCDNQIASSSSSLSMNLMLPLSFASITLPPTWLIVTAALLIITTLCLCVRRSSSQHSSVPSNESVDPQTCDASSSEPTTTTTTTTTTTDIPTYISTGEEQEHKIPTYSSNASNAATKRKVVVGKASSSPQHSMVRRSQFRGNETKR